MTRNLPFLLGHAICLFFTFVSTTTIGQTCLPNCRDVNLSVQTEDGQEFHAKLFWSDFLTNYECALPLTYALSTRQGGPVASGSSDDVGNQEYLLLSAICDHLEQGLVIEVTNALGSCESILTFKTNGWAGQGRSTTVYCEDPLITDPSIYIDGTPVFPIIPCIGPSDQPAEFAGDWAFPIPCEAGIQDTAKIILREWAFYDKQGRRSSIFDTIRVMRHAQLDREHLYCSEADTAYCDNLEKVGPYLIEETYPGSGICDTSYLVEFKTSTEGLIAVSSQSGSKCDLQVHVTIHPFDHGCGQLYKVAVDIKQNCAGSQNLAPCFVPGGNVVEQITNDATYWRCNFWLYNIDTLAPIAYCDYSDFNSEVVIPSQDDGGDHCFTTPGYPGDTSNEPILVASTSSYDCSAATALPAICASDDWSGIMRVQAKILGFGTYILQEDDLCAVGSGSKKYRHDGIIDLPYRNEPYQVIFEISDSCHNIDSIFCYLLVKDRVKPTAVSDKGIQVDLSGAHQVDGEAGKVWVEAMTFNEGSSDNCNIHFLLARRVDWYRACIDLCDSTEELCTYHDIEVREPFFNVDNSVEKHYAETLKWLAEDGTMCANELYNAWKFDLAYYTTTICEPAQSLTRETFLEIMSQDDCDLKFGLEIDNFLSCADDSISYEEALFRASSLGGGWSKSVPFDCDDACKSVPVEILVMDYWCNWSRSWTEVWVEDKIPVEIVQDLSHSNISCKSYRDTRYDFDASNDLISLEDIVEMAENGDAGALDTLNSIFGTYEKVWRGPEGSYLDINGDQVAGSMEVEDSICVCETDTTPVRTLDDHLGYIWKDSISSACSYQMTKQSINRGLVVVNCPQNVHCRQTVWSDFDHCGQGVIYRKFEIWQGCDPNGHGAGEVDTVVRIQQIGVGNHCRLSKEMFDLPEDLEVSSCGIEFDPAGSGNVVGAVDPDSTGRPEYLFDDDCRLVGIAQVDKLFRVVGGDQACYKILRTWYFADWCQQGIAGGSWWKDSDVVIDSFVQKIIVLDTLPPVCVITGPVEDGGLVETSGCFYDLTARIDVMDACGGINYHWELFRERGNEDLEPVQAMDGELSGDIETQFTVNVADLADGQYHLVVRATDACQNESFCRYSVGIQARKKPSPVCISSITAELTPMDLDADGLVDTAMAVVWASEFNSSSSAPCGEDDADLLFFLEILDENNTGFSSLDTLEDLDHLTVGCDDIGINSVRFWVLSSSGTFDYCDVFLMVQSNAEGCSDTIAPTDTITTPDTIVSMPDINTIFGNIRTDDSLGVEGVILPVGDTALNAALDTTDQFGDYQLLVTNGEELTLVPRREDEVTNGVTTHDQITLFNHINGNPLEGPYKRIAADVNGDGVIAQIDVLILRRVILGELSEFPMVDPWRFVRAEYEFGTDLPEQEILDSMITSATITAHAPQIKQDFIAIKTGDLNYDRSTRSRAGEPWLFSTVDQGLLKGREYTISIRSNDLQKLLGYQFTLAYDTASLEWKDVRESGEAELRRDHLGFRFVDKGSLLVSWINEGWDLPSGHQVGLLEIDVVAKKDVQLRDAIAIDDRRLRSEVYLPGKSIVPIALSYSTSEEDYSISQNFPNPWQKATTILVQAARQAQGVLVIHDGFGKEIRRKAISIKPGSNEFSLLPSHMNAKGIYYYSVIIDDFIKTKKMIFID